MTYYIVSQSEFLMILRRICIDKNKKPLNNAVFFFI